MIHESVLVVAIQDEGTVAMVDNLPNRLEGCYIACIYTCGALLLSYLTDCLPLLYQAKAQYRDG